MAALTDTRTTRGKNLGTIQSYKMAASTTVFAGGIVMINSVGLATPATASASNQGCVGVACGTVTSLASGDSFVRVQEGTFLLAGTSLADTSIGLQVFASDDETVDETQGVNEPVAGKLAKVESATSGWVRMGLGFNS